MAFASAWRYFWHTMTSNDRHAAHNSPYRTGQHVALPQNRHTPLTSVATNAADSRPDLTTRESSDPNGYPNKSLPQSPGKPYSPGMKSALQRTQSEEQAASLARTASGEIQLQNFHEGLPPPPPVSHSWKRIDRWAEDNYEELYDNLSNGCTQNDINDLEHELNCTLPLEVRESLQIHDGQERGGLPTGILFGCMLLDCEEIVQEWKNWRRVSEEYLTQEVEVTQQVPLKAFASASSSSQAAQQPPPSTDWRERLLAKQDSQPPDAIQKAYAHPSWIPLARDWGGNNLAIDLAPGPAGKWGQVILTGRDYDCKFVVARSWAAFLAVLADDLNSPKVFVNEETGELKLRLFKEQGVEPPYLDILRWRADQKYGRRPVRRPPPDLTINPNAPLPNPRGSPYGSPTAADSDRGRSPQRFSNKAKMAASSSRNHISSPLARVTEEKMVSKLNMSAEPAENGSSSDGKLAQDTLTNGNDSVPNGEKLVPVETPRGSTYAGRTLESPKKENQPLQPTTGNSGKSTQEEVDDGEMKTVEI